MKETMKKFGAWLMAVALAFAGTAAMAADDEVSVKIGETVTQASFPNAFKGDTEGAEITFLKDVDTSTMGYTSSVGKTIDLNGYTFSTESTVPMGCFGGEWVFKDGKDGEGINLTKSSTKLIQVNDASVTVESGKYAVGADANSYLFSVTFPKKVNRTRDTELVITGGTFVGKLVTFDTERLYTYGIYEPDEVEAYCNQAVRFSGGTFSVEPNDAWIVSGYKKVQDTGTGYWSVVPDTPAVAKIGTLEYETLGAAFAAAKSGDTVELLAASYGENDLADIGKLNDKNVIVVGLGMDKTELKVVYAKSASDVNGLHFQDLTLTINHSGYGMPYTQTLCGTYERVKFNGLIAVDHGTSSFTDCVFTGTTTGDEYILWQYGGFMLVEGCTFKASASKGVVKLYCESSYEAQNLVKDCIFLSVTGSKGCAIYASNSNNLEKPIYEMNIVGNTIPAGIAEYKASGDGLTVVNPVKDANGKFTSGTFISGNVNKGTVANIISGVLAENCAFVPSADCWTVGVKTEDNTIITTKPQESKVEIPQDVEIATEVQQKIEQSTKVEGVKLSATESAQKPAGIVAVVEEAKKNTEFAAAVETATEVSVKVEVAVEPTEYDNTADKGKVAFKLTPTATVTVKQNETELKQVVEVTNDMIDQNQKIAVSIYTGFKPVAITHDDDNGARIETFEGDQIAYNEVTGVATVLISHFSTLTSFGDAADVPPAKVVVAKIGDAEYDTLAAAVAAAQDGDTVAIVSSEAVSINGVSINKNVTIEGVGADKTVLDMGTGSMGGVASKTVTYRNLTLRYNNTGTMPYTQGVNHAMQAYDHVTIAGSIAVMDDTVFDTCTFTGAIDDGTDVPEYLVWIYAHKATFRNCIFEKAGSKGSIKLYAEAGNMCATDVSSTKFEEIGSKGSAIYTSNSNNSASTSTVVYEVVTDEASITVPEGKEIVKASGNGLSVVNPVKDTEGKYIGGQFITASTDQTVVESIIKNVCAEGYAPKKNDDGTYGVEEEIAAVAEIGETEYETLAAAVAAVKAGWTVTLLTDCAEAVTGGEVPFVLEQGGKNFTGSIAAAEGFKTVASPIAGDDSIRYMPVDEDPIITAAMTKVASGFYQSGANYGASTDFYITSKAGLEYFRDIINNFNGEAAAYRDSAAGAGLDLTAHRFSGKTINLLADVDLNNEVWTPIGRATDRDMLAGTFDGNNHVVSNLKTVYTTEGKDQAGFFGYSNKSFTIKNLTLRNVDITGFAYVGALISTGSKADSEIVNCHVVGSVSISAVGSYVGGIVGHGYCSVSNCSVEATGGTGISVTGGGILVGGIYGYAASNPGNIADCSVSGLSISLAQNYVAGGIVGGVDRPLTVSGCSVEDVAIKCQRGPYLGYVVGSIQGGDGILAIADCTVANSTLLSHVDKYTEKEETYLVQCGAYDAPTCYYVGSNVETDGNGKVIGGTFEWLPDGLVAAGYEKVAQSTTPETWVVQEKPAPVVPIAEIVGKEGAYTSLDDAIQAAGADDVIRMLADADVGDVMGAYRSQKGYAYKLPGNLTIDLDNHEVKLSSVALHESDAGGKLLFEDGKININGAMGVAIEAKDASSVFYVGKQGTLEFNSVDIVGTNVAASVIFRTYTLNAPLMRFDDCTISIDGCNDFAHTIQRVEFEDTQVQIKNNSGRVFRDNDGHTNDGGSKVTLLRSSVSVDGISNNGGEDVNAIVLDASSLTFKNYETESMGANGCNIELKNGSSFVLDGVGSHGFTNGKLVVSPGCTVDVKNVAYLGLNVKDGSVFKAGSKVSVSNCCTTTKTSMSNYYNKDIAMWSSGGSVVIENGADVKIDGRLIVKSGSLAIADGRYKSVEVEAGTLTLTGGIYSTEPTASYVDSHYVVVNNPDDATKETYPWKVQEPTVTTKEDAPIVIDISGKTEDDPSTEAVEVPVTVTQELAKEILGAGTDVTQPLTSDQVTTIVEKLETKGEDGMTGWQKYTAGFSQTDKHPLAPKGKGTEDGKLVLVTSLVAPKQLSVDTGVKVKYILKKATEVNPKTGVPDDVDFAAVQELPTPEFPVDVTTLQPETYWKIDVEYTATKVVETEVETGN